MNIFNSKLDSKVINILEAISREPLRFSCKNDFRLTHLESKISFQEAVTKMSQGEAVEFIPVTSNHFKWINFTEKNKWDMSSWINENNYIFRVKPDLTLDQAVIYLSKGERVTYTLGNKTKELKLSDLTNRFVEKNPAFKLIPNLT